MLINPLGADPLAAGEMIGEAAADAAHAEHAAEIAEIEAGAAVSIAVDAEAAASEAADALADMHRVMKAIWERMTNMETDIQALASSQEIILDAIEAEDEAISAMADEAPAEAPAEEVSVIDATGETTGEPQQAEEPAATDKPANSDTRSQRGTGYGWSRRRRVAR